jgi:2-C-methyl-D-erythritol 4-phosphate cytidylyltransferase
MSATTDTIPSFDEVFDRAWVIIVAGGSGTRMQSTKPKQFLILDGKPILLRSVEQFTDLGLRKVILVLPEDHIERWSEIVTTHQFKVQVKVVVGGSTRTISVRNGLEAVPVNATIVGIHDAVRPMVSPDVIKAAYASAYMHGSGVPTIPVTDSIRQLIGLQSKALDRRTLVAVQTPQVFRANTLKDAYAQLSIDDVSDDATVWEMAGNLVRLTLGSKSNLKITTPEDLVVLRALTKAQRESETKV